MRSVSAAISSRQAVQARVFNGTHDIDQQPGLGRHLKCRLWRENGLKALQATSVEVVLTFFLTFTFWAVLVDERGPRAMAPFAVGLVIIAGGLAGSAFTGAAMNPVRWLGPALASVHLSNWLIWTVGPLLGGLLGSLAYEALFLSEFPAVPSGTALGPDDQEEEQGEELEAAVPPPAASLPAEPPSPEV